MSDLYFYWRLPVESVAAADAAFRAWHQEFNAEGAGLSARLFVRHAEAPEASTLMEVYAASDAWRERLVQEGDALSARWRSGPRHLEVFDELT